MASNATVTLNSKTYAISKIREYQLDPLSEAIRTTGVQTRSDNFKVNRYVQGWENGIFWDSQKRESGRGVGGVRDADAETRFDTATLPLNPQSVSADLYSAEGEHFQTGYAKFLNGLWLGLNRTNSASNNADNGVVKFGATSDNLTAGNIDIGGGASDTHYGRSFAVIVHKGELFLLAGYDDASTERYNLNRSVDGVSFDSGAAGVPDAPFTTDLLTTASLAGNDWRDQFGAMVNFGDKLVIGVRELAASDAGSVDQFLFYSSATATGTPAWDLDTVIPSSTNQIKMHLWRDHLTANAPTIPVAVLNEGIYQIDTVGETFETIALLGGASGDGLASAVAVADLRLYVGTADGNILAYSVTGVDGLSTEDIGPASYGDGPVAARRGYATFIYGDYASGLFVGYGGNAASKNASIFYYRFIDKTWHSIYQDTTPNREITQITLSTADDGVMRLHFNTEGTTDDVPQMIEEPLVGISAGATQQYRTTGHVEFPKDDLGDPHTNAAIFKALLDDDGSLGVDTTKNYVELKYGLDGAAYTTVTLGNFLSTAPTQTFGASGVGVSGKKISVRLNLFGDDAANTNTPEIDEFEIQSRNRITVLKGWEMEIDLADSVRVDDSFDTPEDVISALDTLQATVTLVPFLIGDRASTLVEMAQGSWALQLVGDDGGDDGQQLGQRTGKATIKVEQVI